MENENWLWAFLIFQEPPPLHQVNPFPLIGSGELQMDKEEMFEMIPWEN